MSLNFLNNTCAELPRNDKLFGLCDDEDGRKAYSNVDEPDSWIATVQNEQAITLTFTPVDKCVIQDNEFEGRGRCDGLLTSTEHLYFIELKNQARNWIGNALEQLESTIEFFKVHHDIDSFKHKKAFACNKKHRHFQTIDNEMNLRFFRKYKVRIDVQAKILIV